MFIEQDQACDEHRVHVAAAEGAVGVISKNHLKNSG
jgi:hypothetical protein